MFILNQNPLFVLMNVSFFFIPLHVLVDQGARIEWPVFSNGAKQKQKKKKVAAFLFFSPLVSLSCSFLSPQDLPQKRTMLILQPLMSLQVRAY